MNTTGTSSSEDILAQDRDAAKGIYFIAASQFGIAFSFNCIMSFMPFYILKVSYLGVGLGSFSVMA